MNKIKADLIETINNIPDSDANSFEELIEAICIRYHALKGIEDIENNNIMTAEELRKDVSNWK